MNNLKYKTFDSLMADVMVDFRSYAQASLIDPQELIRVVRWVTQDLGLRIFQTKEEILEINNGHCRLPRDYYAFNFGLLIDQGSRTIIPPQGIRTDVVPYPQYSDAPPVTENCNSSSCPQSVSSCGGCGNCGECTPTLTPVPGFNPLHLMGDPCVKPRVFMNCKGEAFELVQILQTQIHKWHRLIPVRLVESLNIPGTCPNRHVHCSDKIWIKDDFLYSNLNCGQLYINYEGILEDSEGNLLVVDRPKITEYYEYKVKHRILENLYLNGEDVGQKLGYIKEELRRARVEAISIVRMPNFKEIQDTWALNRKAFNARYVDMFVKRYFYGWQSWGY